jgi:LacI family transcriptional regulator
MPTIKDVAREAGVSIATVSYVLNHKTDAVSDETRRLVWEAVERIGYTPNITARNLQASKSRLIGYAWHEAPRDQVNSVLDRFTYFLAQSAEAAGYHILTFTYPPNDPLPVYEDLIRTGRVDGFVVSGTRLDDARIAALMRRGVPFVSFGRSTPAWSFSWVDTDGAAGLRIAVQHVAELGHQRIGFLGWPPPSLAGEYRKAGFRAGMAAMGLPVDEELLWHGEYAEDTGRVALRRWLKLPAAKRPTAILVVSDLMAIGLINEADQHGIEVGRDLSIVGFDDAPTSQYMRPPLTSLRQPIADIAQAVISLLETRLNSPAGPHGQRLFVPRLIVRKSTGPAPETNLTP